MIEIDVDTHDIDRATRALAAMLDKKQVDYAIARALNDCTRAASVAVNDAMASVFDRPTAFTKAAAVAPRSLAATRDSLASTVTLRDVQAKYLGVEETGGERTPAMNTRNPQARALVLPGVNLRLDSYGNIPRGAVARLKAMLNAQAGKHTAQLIARRRKAGKRVRVVPNRDRGVFYVPAGHRLPGGFWQRLPGHRITHLIAFATHAEYTARLGYHARVEAVFKAEWPKAMAQRLAEAAATAR